MKWQDWVPSLDQGDLTLRDIYDSMPKHESGDIDELVRIFENPTSPYAFPGAVDLFRHDCIHIVLGRGLLMQDEAFVIGYTMGTAKELISWEQAQCFKMVASVAYKNPYTFRRSDLIAFDIGFSLGIVDPCEHIYEFPFKDHLDTPVDQLRELLGIDKRYLWSTYRTESLQIPNTKESQRLPIGEQPH